MTIVLPRRLTPPAAPGSLLKQNQVPVPRVPRAEPDNDPSYLAMVRGCPCLSCGTDPCGEAAHLRLASAAHGKSSGLGKRPADRWALSLCPQCHRLNRDAQHNRSEAAFWVSLGIDAAQTATLLYARRGDLVAMRAVVITTIMNREKPG